MKKFAEVRRPTPADTSAWVVLIATGHVLTKSSLEYCEVEAIALNEAFEKALAEDAQRSH